MKKTLLDSKPKLTNHEEETSRLRRQHMQIERDDSRAKRKKEKLMGKEEKLLTEITHEMREKMREEGY